MKTPPASVISSLRGWLFAALLAAGALTAAVLPAAIAAGAMSGPAADGAGRTTNAATPPVPFLIPDLILIQTFHVSGVSGITDDKAADMIDLGRAIVGNHAIELGSGMSVKHFNHEYSDVTAVTGFVDYSGFARPRTTPATDYWEVVWSSTIVPSRFSTFRPPPVSSGPYGLRMPSEPSSTNWEVLRTLYAADSSTPPAMDSGATGSTPASLSTGVPAGAPGNSRRAPPMPANPKLPTIWLIGDSTVRNGQDDGQNKGPAGLWGWGHTIADYFDPAKVNLVNRAAGGTSSRSFYAGQWPGILANVKAGDFVIMQFGHNDNNGVFTGTGGYRASLNGSGDETQQVPNARTGQPETVHSFGWYLKQYVAETRAKGATPVICSLIPRKLWAPDGLIMRHNENYFDYTAFAADVAKSEKVAYVDLHEIVARKYDELGHDAVMKLFPDPVTSPTGTVSDEHTHTNLAGAVLNAESVIGGLKALKDSPLVAFLSAKAKDIAPADLTKPAPPVKAPAPATPATAAPGMK